MEKIQIFVVFHKYIFDGCYSAIPDDVLYKYFTFIAVNKNIEKKYTPNRYKVINEWELPIYDNKFQERGYNENSAIYHIYANELHKEYDYIGFFQYDMIFKENIINLIQTHVTSTPINFYFNSYDFNFCSYDTWNEPDTLEYIIKDYEKFFNTSFNKSYKFPLYNSYIIPTNLYKKIMKWVIQLYDKLYPWCINPPNMGHFGHIGGIYERIMAYAIGSENLQNINLNIAHDINLKNISY